MKEFFLLRVIVEDEQYRSQSPGNGIAQQDVGNARSVRHHEENPDDTQDTYTAAGHQHRNQNISHTS